jgi:hypothetical protein
MPLLVIKHDAGSVISPETEIEIGADRAILLGHTLVPVNGATAHVWILRHRHGADRGAVRRLRIQLVRLHCEREALRRILTNIRMGRIPICRGSTAFDRLQDFLLRSAKLLRAKSVSGLPVSEVLSLAYRSFDLADVGDTATIMAELDDARRQVRLALEDAIRSSQHGANVSNYIYWKGDYVPTDRHDIHQVVTGPVQGDVNAVAASVVNHSLNRVAASPAGELRDLLLELSAKVDAMVKLLPTEDARAAAEHLDTLTAQVTSSSPDKHWYSVSAEGLMDAARKLGQAGLPIIDLVLKVIHLVGG